ncbi:hypothetical protein POM88_021500 [Heracleum sosnowskyi]|uniref:Peptidase M16 C-terminal domain-containing protein n=1 Tax=Heracleum sosnowskyi TaxID=360622 RepID=A0AAD8IDM3_9APIA|nr:hypothetical protein POM88_021500 [Heracleum sosnowskyi]
MVIVASGAFKHEEIVEKEKSIFLKLSHGSTTSSENVDADAPLAQFAVAFKGSSWKDPDSTTLMAMEAMLGSYTKHTKSSGVGEFKISQLVQKLEVDKMAESMMPFNIKYKDTGLFGIYATAK